jgi:hypothetical protein
MEKAERFPAFALLQGGEILTDRLLRARDGVIDNVDRHDGSGHGEHQAHQPSGCDPD